MNIKSAKSKAKKQLVKIQNLLKKAASGGSTGELGTQLFVDDAAELVKYYKLVSTGKFSKAGVIQTYDMDTATYELIDSDIYEFINDHNHPVEVAYEE